MAFIKNGNCIKSNQIETLTYNEFQLLIDELLQNENCHCVNYFAYPTEGNFQCIACIANDETEQIQLISHIRDKETPIEAITAKHYAFHCFEREMHENYGLAFSNHPWLKPIRYPHQRSNTASSINNYPFYAIEGESLHEVGVGPIHAGIIEPGYFRFICSGEKVLHLEIVLGYQHRGIENLIIKKQKVLQQCILAEGIAGDTVAGHTLAFSTILEGLSGTNINRQLNVERTIALELERIAIHIGDTAAMCTDIAYQLGQVVCEALRTIVINTTQAWCGNRFAKNFIRPTGTHYPLTAEIRETISKNLKEVKKRYNTMANRMFDMPSVLARFETIGELTRQQALLIGAVGMAAKSSGLARDIRHSHPFAAYPAGFKPITLETGDVGARTLLRKLEVNQSIDLIFDLLEEHSKLNQAATLPQYDLEYEPESFCLSLVEGWRGEICHIGITDEQGKLSYYKIKDPSLHNWMGLALAVRNQEISDFPICNKSFDLSYCGHDL